MSAPNPNTFKNLIPGATSALCEKLNKLAVGLSTAFYDWVAFEYNEDGASLTDEYIALLCAAQCNGGRSGGGNTDNPNMPAPTGVSASDGTYTSKVFVSWNEVTPPSGSVSSYLVYRSLSTNTDPAASALIATVSGTTFSYDDTTIVPGTNYNYWVKATNGTDVSAYAGPDSGYGSAYETGFTAVSDLKATQGFSESTTGLIALVFNPAIGTTAVDVYRNTTDDSSTATLIHADVVCNDTTASEPTIADGVGVNNISGYVIYDQPPDGATKYYYWVKVKTNAPPRISDFSNSAVGWVQIGTGDSGVTGRQKITTGPNSITVPGGVTQMRVVMRGGGGAGAGSSPYYGAGGGAGGDVLLAVIDVTPGEQWEYTQYFLVNPSASSGNPAGATPLSGLYSYEGKSSKLTRTADSKVVIAAGGGSGLYSPSGSGSAGPAATSGASLIQSGINYSDLVVYRGSYGETGQGSRGGRGGESFGKYATSPAHYLAGSFSGDGPSGSGGGGSSAFSTYTGGTNGVGDLVICFFS